MATAVENPPQPLHQRFMAISGATDPVWTDVCIIGSGISGNQTAYKLVTHGQNVIMLEARKVITGETGKTSVHLVNALDDGYVQMVQKHGDQGAILAAESHAWASTSTTRNKKSKERHEEIEDLKKEVAKANAIGMEVGFKEGFAVPGWDGQPDQRDAAIF